MLRCRLIGHSWLYYDKAKFISHSLSMNMEPIKKYEFCKRRCIRCGRKEETNESGLYGMKWRRVK